ncbi:Glycosyl transferase, family 2 [Rubellimicrobium mesophilum DSM 19309]|uniref:Glycosyl transferase, family 2 n=1 Tax=Rubellimicrobium mesophilum DSM 19309 TaxID=442562 RepID=A0A017HRJ8_9RHOB|nr:glycosyltransferase [Rubellimicrobium mesophilum]EYD76793.1 Glycosyl transferase, family 2 [Rubellimicrobium mesophilum DSM 19309]
MKLPTEKELADLRRSEFFDPSWYRRTYPDVDVLGMDPAEHYLKYGTRMCRDPGPNISSVFLRVAFNMGVEHEPIARLQWLTQKGIDVTTPERKNLLKAAHSLALRGEHARAIALAEQYMPEDLAHTIHILRANAAISVGHEAAWLEHLNSYLNHFDVAPVRLDGSGTVIDRLSTTALPEVTGGPLISVIMPAWNAEKTVRMAAGSILNQTWRNLELLIVDDCSDDGTWTILQQIAASDDRVRIQRSRVNAGPYVSKNVALMQARGEWITGHDADDWAHPQRLERQISFLRARDQSACLAGMLRMTAQGNFVRLNSLGKNTQDGACRSAFISLMVESTFFHDLLGSWDQVRVGGDSEMIRRIEKLNGKDIAQLDSVTMLCLDNPEGLTNHPVLGFVDGQRASPFRIEYMKSYAAWHQELHKLKSRLAFPSVKRAFAAPAEILNGTEVVGELMRELSTADAAVCPELFDVAIVTNLVFPGGNTSSTLDELSFFQAHGLKVLLVHSPTNGCLGKPISHRYNEYKSIIRHWTQVGNIKAKVLICRHPGVITSDSFRHLVGRIEAVHVFAVINNSHLRPDGGLIYDIGSMAEMIGKIKSERTTICPISPVMREELVSYSKATGMEFDVSPIDWTPTFDLAMYRQPPKPTMARPFQIGRHGRDGPEKWHEDREKLSLVYPSSPDFEIRILGGASRAKKTLGALPSNWEVHEFGAIEPYDYLSTLDAFVYFPHTGLTEGFGRTVVEAMLAGVPCILPSSFRGTFGDLAIYCEPEAVESVVRCLAADDQGRLGYLLEVQNIAVERFSSAVIAGRLAGTRLDVIAGEPTGGLQLSVEGRNFKRMIESSVVAEV